MTPGFDPLLAAAVADALLQVLGWLGAALAGVAAIVIGWYGAVIAPRRRRRQELADRNEAATQAQLDGLSKADLDHERLCAHRWSEQAAGNARVESALGQLKEAVDKIGSDGRQDRRAIHGDVRDLAERVSKIGG